MFVSLSEMRSSRARAVAALFPIIALAIGWLFAMSQGFDHPIMAAFGIYPLAIGVTILFGVVWMTAERIMAPRPVQF